MKGRNEKKVEKPKSDGEEGDAPKKDHSIPGPGKYDAKIHNSKGKYVLSNFYNHSAVNWANLKSNRFKYDSKKILTI